MKFVENLFRFFLVLWILFIPLKTVFYQLAWVGLIVTFFAYCFMQKGCAKEFVAIFKYFKDVSILFSLIIVSMIVASLLNPAHQEVHWRWIFSYIFQYFVIFFILLFMYRRRVFSTRFLIATIFVVLGIYAMDGIWQLSFGEDLLRHKIGSLERGLTGPTHNRNVYGMLMAITAYISFALAIMRYRSLRKKELLFLWFLFFIALIDLLLSYSRASWLFFFTASAIFVGMALKKGLFNKKMLFFALSMAFGIAVLLYLNDPHLQHRFAQLLHGHSSYRLQMWPLTIEQIKKHWLFGHGLVDGNFFLYQVVSHYRYIHNSFLEILFSVGLVGFVFYTLLLGVILREILRLSNPLYIGLFFGFLVLFQFDHSMIKGSIQLSILTIFAFFVFKERLKKVEL